MSKIKQKPLTEIIANKDWTKIKRKDNGKRILHHYPIGAEISIEVGQVRPRLPKSRVLYEREVRDLTLDANAYMILSKAKDYDPCLKETFWCYKIQFYRI